MRAGGILTSGSRTITDIIGNYVDLDRLLALAKEIPSSRKSSPLDPRRNRTCASESRYDEAFNFYYADLFDVLPSLGAKCSAVQPHP